MEGGRILAGAYGALMGIAPLVARRAPVGYEAG